MLENQKPETRAELKEQSSKPQPKVVAATVGAGVGAATAIVGGWILETAFHVTMPEEVKLSLGVIITAGLTFTAGYLKRN